MSRNMQDELEWMKEIKPKAYQVEDLSLYDVIKLSGLWLKLRNVLLVDSGEKMIKEWVRVNKPFYSEMIIISIMDWFSFGLDMNNEVLLGKDEAPRPIELYNHLQKRKMNESEKLGRSRTTRTNTIKTN